MSETPAVPVDNNAQTEDQKAKDKLILDQAGKSADANMAGMNNVMVFIQAFLQMLTTGNFDMETFTKTIKDTLGKDIKLPEDAADKNPPAQTAAASDSTYVPVDLNTMSTADLARLSLEFSLPLSNMLGVSDVSHTLNMLPVLVETLENNPDVKAIDVDMNEKKFIVTGADGVQTDISYAPYEIKMFDAQGNDITPEKPEPDENSRISIMQDGAFVKSGVKPQEFLADLRQTMIASIEESRKDPNLLKLEEAIMTGKKPYEPEPAAQTPEEPKGYQEGVNGPLTYRVETPPEGAVTVDVTGEKCSFNLGGAFGAQCNPDKVEIVDAKVDQAPALPVPHPAMDAKEQLFSTMVIK